MQRSGVDSVPPDKPPYIATEETQRLAALVCFAPGPF
jgi:hypothetical protein